MVWPRRGFSWEEKYFRGIVDNTLQETVTFTDKKKIAYNYSDPGGTLEKFNNLKPSFSGNENEELYISKEVEENAVASEGKSCQPEKNNRSNNMRVTTSQYEISGKNHICSVKTFSSRAWSTRHWNKLHWNKQHFGMRLCCLPTPCFIPGVKKGFIKGEVLTSKD